MKILTLNLHERNATITDIVSRYIPCLKHLDALFCDLDSLCFAYRISSFFQNKIMELFFFFCKKYLAPQINTDHDLFTLPSSPKDTLFKMLNDATEYFVVRHKILNSIYKILNSIPWSACQIKRCLAHPTPIWLMTFKHCMGGHSVDGEQGS